MTALPRVLYVDSEPLMIRAVGRFLQKEPYEARFAQSAHETLLLVALLKFDLILIDHRLRDMSVIELVRRVRVVQPFARLVLVGGYLEPAKQAALGSAISACIPKPWDNRRFVTLLGELLRYPAS